MTRSSDRSLTEAAAHTVRTAGRVEPGDPLVVAVSGGVDSLVLLHLLLEGGFQALHVAHVDHRMRAESGDDARTLRSLVDPLDIPFHLRILDVPPRNEAEARSGRYAALRAVRREVGARWILTAHHEDDQRETILYRILRGTGIRGLRGMSVTRSPDLLRPLLAHGKEEILRYAEENGLEPLEDPSNRDPSWARNRIRHEALPLLEAIHPGAPRALLRLARRAREAEAVKEHLLAPHLERLMAGAPEVPDRRGIPVAREALLAYPSAVRAEILRALARRLGARLSESGTAAAMEFIRTGSSGGSLRLSDSLLLSRDFSVLRLRRDGPEDSSGGGGPKRGAPGADPDRIPPGPGGAQVTIPAGETGSRRLDLPGRSWHVRFATGEGEGLGETRRMANWTAFRTADLHGPLVLRTRSPGDRAGLPGHRKKVKKLLQELRIPREDRDSLPLLVDGRGLAIWIPGHWRAPLGEPEDARESWLIGVDDVSRSA